MPSQKLNQIERLGRMGDPSRHQLCADDATRRLLGRAGSTRGQVITPVKRRSRKLERVSGW